MAELELARDALDGGRQAEARLDAHDEQVERIGEAVAQALDAPLPHVLEHDDRAGARR